MSSLTAKQERFCLEYVVDFNATQAAIRAGYSEHTSYSIGWENLKKPEIANRLAELRTKDAIATQLTREYVIEGLMGIAEYGDKMLSARVRAYELLGKHLAMFTDRLEITQMPDQATVHAWIEALEADIAAADSQ
jgi:phage terminase small subunit